MTAVGHSIVGATMAVWVLQSGASAKRKAITLAMFAFLANLPDLPFPGWGHDDYLRSHSFLVVGVLMGVLALALYLLRVVRTFIGSGWVLVAAVAAALSHIVLDATYNHGLGLGVLWPLSEARLALPIPFLETVREPFPAFTRHTARVMGIEALFYGAILLATLGLKKMAMGKLGRGETSG